MPSLSDQIWLTLFGGLLTLLGVVVGAILNHYLEKQRKKEELLLNTKIGIYAKILAGMNYSFLSEEKDLVKVLSDPHFNTKMKMTFGELLSQGRLVANAELEEKFRQFYECEIATWEAIEKGASPQLNEKRGLLCREIESLMRKELGVKTD